MRAVIPQYGLPLVTHHDFELHDKVNNPALFCSVGVPFPRILSKRSRVGSFWHAQTPYLIIEVHRRFQVRPLNSSSFILSLSRPVRLGGVVGLSHTARVPTNRVKRAS